MSTLVVRAKHDFETTDDGNRWNVQKGDLGVLKWVAHKRNPRFVEARVIWDRDPERKVRRLILSSIVIVGLQNADSPRDARLAVVKVTRRALPARLFVCELHPRSQTNRAQCRMSQSYARLRFCMVSGTSEYHKSLRTTRGCHVTVPSSHWSTNGTRSLRISMYARQNVMSRLNTCLCGMF
jgi:hypothetical protein